MNVKDRVVALAVLGMAFVSGVLFAAPTVTDVVAKQRYPWNGKVDITYMVTGNVAEGFPSRDFLAIQVEAMDRVNGISYVAESMALSGDTGNEEGFHHVVWDINAQGLEIKSDRVIFTVKYYVQKMYCVIDLSKGADAVSYPVSYLASEPSGGWTDEYKKTKLVLRYLSAGTFKMQNDSNVTLTKPFYIGVFEVTQKQYSLVMGSNPSYYTGDICPVGKVSYNMIRGTSNGAQWPSSSAVDSDSFMGKLRARTGLDFDLPTEAQWEYACRAGTTTTYYWGNYMNGNYAWYKDNSKYFPHNVGTKTANAWGLYDMSGNAVELCLDWHGTLSYGTDPKGSSSGSDRVMRGGAWGYSADYCTSSYRYGSSPSDEGSNFGFRLVRTLPE